jgi:hypothetical protein
MLNTSQEYIQLGKKMLSGAAEDLREGIMNSETPESCGRVNAVSKRPLKQLTKYEEYLVRN